MQQLLGIWMNLDVRRQIAVTVATVCVLLALFAMSRIAAAPSMQLLYAGLDNRAAGDVVAALEQRGVPYEVRGSSIFVDGRSRDELRLTLASEGLPANTNTGYELLDNLTGFGTTSQMFDAAYWRAKEGELARTIVSSPHVSMARVHIASTGANPFQRSVTPTASVSVTPNGSELTAQHAKSIRFLVASAVAGLSPDDVSVIDANGGLIGVSDEATSAGSADDKAEILRQRVERLLEARVGKGNAIVEVSVDTVTETEEIRERRFDPNGRVVISTDSEERSSTSNDAGTGDVTVASNLPDGDGAAGENSSSQESETRERVNYEVSETERSVTRASGAIKRLTVAVLVNEDTGLATGTGTEPAVRSEEEMESLRELVASAVGFDESRGDIITIKSMTLQLTSPAGTEVQSSVFDYFQLDLMSAIQMAVLAIVVLILGLFVLRPVLSQPVVPAALPARSTTAGALQTPASSTEALTGEVSDLPDDFPEITLNTDPFSDVQPMEFATASDAKMGPSTETVDRLRALIGERQEETVEILRRWLEESEERV